MLFACEYDWAGPFFSDAAIVKKNGKYGAVNRSGKIFVPFSYTSREQADREIYGREDYVMYNGGPEMESSNGYPSEEDMLCEYAGFFRIPTENIFRMTSHFLCSLMNPCLIFRRSGLG